MKSALGTAAASLFNTLFPSSCRFCNAPLIKVTRVPVCDACLQDVVRVQGNICSVCGNQILSSLSTDVSRCCGDCLQSPPPFEKAVAYGSYEAGLRELIHLLKYDRVRPAADVLGRMVSDTLLQFAAEFADARPVVIPVPLHERKLRERGFNQSLLIARAALKNLPVGDLKPFVLQRVRATESQTGLTPAQRRSNIKGAFRVTEPACVSGRTILLIDDVFTTGTTAYECARVLRKSAAARVFVVTVARVLLPHDTGTSLRDIDAVTSDGLEPLAKAARA